ncbi:MAG: DNA repair protein RecO [Lachnospiraceae bacterium]|jgi:DNA repair protein RecO (recombination protein O)
MGNVSVTGMVVSQMQMGEYDRRIELLTKELGRISAFARGARKPSSDLIASSCVFAFGQFELFQGKNSYTLKSARISNYFTELAGDIELSYYGFYFLEICRYFSRENVEAGDMLALAYFSLRALLTESLDRRLVRSVFEIRMLNLNGLCPAAEDIISPESRYSPGFAIDESTAHAIRHVLLSPLNKLYTFKLSEEVLSCFTDVAGYLMNRFVDRKFKSLEFIR